MLANIGVTNQDIASNVANSFIVIGACVIVVIAFEILTSNKVKDYFYKRRIKKGGKK